MPAFCYFPDLASQRSLKFSTPASPYSSLVARISNLNRGELVNRGDLVCTIVAAFTDAFSEHCTVNSVQYCTMAAVLSGICNVKLVTAVSVCSAIASLDGWIVQCSALYRAIWLVKCAVQCSRRYSIQHCLMDAVCSAVQCAVYRVQFTVYNTVQYSVLCSLYSAQCSAVQCRVYKTSWWMQCAVSNL